MLCSFDLALDEFYSKQEEQKEQLRLIKEKQAALSTVERERQRHQAQIDSLANVQHEVMSKAELIMTNLPAVEKVITDRQSSACHRVITCVAHV